LRYSQDPPGSGEPSKVSPSTAFERAKSVLPVVAVAENGDGGAVTEKKKDMRIIAENSKNKGGIPWKKILLSWPVWAIVVNNFTFHYSLYVLMNWLPTYFDQGLRVSLSKMGMSKALPYFLMFVFSNVGGVVADHLITRRIYSVTMTRKLLNTLGFFVAAVGLVLMTNMESATAAVIWSSVVLGACSFARAGFAVNHMDIAPRYAGIVMGVSNTAGTVAGVIGVAATGWILESSQSGSADLSNWSIVFAVPAILSILSALIFCVFATGERIFE
jgi:ACS family sodium-dependent inorganic phosphate cotransporter